LAFWLGWRLCQGSPQSESVSVNIDAPRSLRAGQEFEYIINYQNTGKINLDKLELNVVYPENFIFSSSEPAATNGSNYWQLSALAAGSNGQVKIKGGIINQVGQANVILAELYYQPANFSSEFKTTASLDSAVETIGLETALVRSDSALVGEVQKMVFKYKLKNEGELKNFWLKLEPEDGAVLEFIDEDNDTTGLSLVKPWVWEIKEAVAAEREVKITFRFIDKPKDDFKFKLILEAKPPTDDLALGAAMTAPATSTATSGAELLAVDLPKTQTYVFYSEEFSVELVKNDLNLSLVVNGSDKDQGVDFGQTLHYAIAYANKGQTAIDEVVVMAVLEGNILDWSSLTDKAKGKIKNNSLIWTKSELPELARLEPGQSGIIDFAIKVKELSKLKNKSFDQEIKSYAQFSAKKDKPQTDVLADKEQEKTSDKSNTITNKIKSDLRLEQKLFYFNEDNLALGLGPLPFAVGQTTEVRATWRLVNTLHDINQIKVSVKLPDYVSWPNKSRAAVGTIEYNQTERIVSWVIPALSLIDEEASVEFSLAVNPTDKERRQLLVLLNQPQIEAVDAVTGDKLIRQGGVKTSKLEDDPLVATGDVDINGGLVK